MDLMTILEIMKSVGVLLIGSGIIIYVIGAFLNGRRNNDRKEV